VFLSPVLKASRVSEVRKAKYGTHKVVLNVVVLQHVGFAILAVDVVQVVSEMSVGEDVEAVHSDHG